MFTKYHLYLLHVFYYVNYYNIFIIFVFMFMGGSMLAVMLLLCYLPMCCCWLPTPMTLASGGESDVPACGPPTSLSVHLASSAVTPAGSAHKSRGDNVVRMWVLLKR